MEKEDVLIGKNLPFEDVLGQPMMYLSHVLFAHMEGKEVVSASVTMPYALLTLDISKNIPSAMFAVVHRIDFQNLYRLQEEGFLDKEKYQVVVMYKPAIGFKKIFAGILPKLEYQVFKVDENGSWIDNKLFMLMTKHGQHILNEII